MQLKKLISSIAVIAGLLIGAGDFAHASSSVTASARQYTSANSEFHSNADNAWNSPTTGSFSVGGWMYLTDISANRPIWSKDFGGAGSRTFFLMANAAPDYRFGLSSDGTNLTVKSSATATATATWVFIVGVFDNAGDTIGISINGANLETTAFAGDAADTTSDIEIGRYSKNSGPTNMNGRIATPFYYSKALSNSEISALYNSGSGVLYKDLSASQKTSLEFWSDGAETSGNLIDASGNSRHFTDNNTVTTAAGKVTYTAEDASDFESGNSEYLSMTDAASADLNFSGANTVFYMSFWFKPESLSSQAILVSKILDNGEPGYQWDIRVLSDGTAMFVKGYSTSSYAQPNYTSTVMTAGNWYFIEAYNSGTACGVSVNRGTDATVADTNNFRSTTGKFRVGCRPDADDYDEGSPTDGVITNIVFITGAVPTTAERDALYGRGFGVDYSDKPTLSSATYSHWWEMTEASGDRADSHGSYTLTDNNTVTGASGVVYDVAVAAARRIIS